MVRDKDLVQCSIVFVFRFGFTFVLKLNVKFNRVYIR